MAESKENPKLVKLGSLLEEPSEKRPTPAEEAHELADVAATMWIEGKEFPVRRLRVLDHVAYPEECAEVSFILALARPEEQTAALLARMPAVITVMARSTGAERAWLLGLGSPVQLISRWWKLWRGLYTDGELAELHENFTGTPGRGNTEKQSD